jgi:hypothetical protein
LQVHQSCAGTVVRIRIEWRDGIVRGTHSDNLVELEGAHLAPVVLGAGPFWVDHCEVGDMGKLPRGGWKRKGKGGR